MKKKRPVLNTTLFKAVQVMKAQRALGDEIGVKQQLIWSWLYRTGVVPAEYVLAIEKATREQGDIVTRYELRPDIYPQEAA